MRNLMDIANEAVEEYHALQKPAELAVFLGLAKAYDPGIVVEVGFSLGGTLRALVQALPGRRRFISIDLPGGKFGGSNMPAGERFRLLTQVNPSISLDIVQGDSRSVRLPFKQADLIFIDGDHSFEGVKADYLRYNKMVRKGGILALHDIVTHPPETEVEVSRLWSHVKVFKKGSTVEIIDTPDPWAGIGVVLI